MSWEREPLFAKAKLFLQKANQEDREGLFFGLFSSMSLELLARAAVSFVSPTLLAEPDNNHQHLLHALNLGSAKSQKKSISTSTVLFLCQTLITEFTDTNYKSSSAIINRRNEEVHTGSASFLAYPPHEWIAAFFECSKILCEFQGETLASYMGEDLEKEAMMLLDEAKQEVYGTTKSLIAAHNKVFDKKDSEIKEKLKSQAQEESEKLSYQRHHKVKCPSCGATATVTGEPYGKDNIENSDHGIVIRQSIIPTEFRCTACELQLSGHSALIAAGVGNHYTRKTSYDPSEYYGMIDPYDSDGIEERYKELHPTANYREWDNE